MAKQKVKKMAFGGRTMPQQSAAGKAAEQATIMAQQNRGQLPQKPMGGIRFPSDFTPPAPGQTYINPNIKPAGVTGTLPPRLQQAAAPSPALVRGMARDQAGLGRRFKSGGTASSRADGIAVKGKTRGKIC